MKKRIYVRVAGYETPTEVQIDERTVSDDILGAVGLSRDTHIVEPGTGMPPFGADEAIFQRVREGGRIFVVPAHDS